MAVDSSSVDVPGDLLLGHHSAAVAGLDDPRTLAVLYLADDNLACPSHQRPASGCLGYEHWT